MPRYSLAFLLAASLLAASPAFASPDCKALLTGRWVTQGNVEMGIAKVKVDNRDEYNADGSFKSVRRYVNQSGKWEQQDMSGKWSAKAGAGSGECVIEMAMKSEFGEASSSSTVKIVDKDTFRSFGVDAKRAK